MRASGTSEQKCSGNTKVRAYFFTINNIDEATELKFRAYTCKYQIYQIEKGEKSGIVHLQGMMYYKNPRGFREIKKDFPTARIEACRDVNDCITYCSKDDTRIRGPYETGEKPVGQGKRTDLLALNEQIKNGTKVLDIRQDDPMIYHQYGRTLNQLETDAKNKNIRSEMTEGLWIYGSSGKGKSHMARELSKGKTVYVHTTKDKGWWDRYDQQEVVIIDDYRGEIDYNELLKLVDKWEHYVVRRGKDPISFTSPLVIITSSLPPNKVYNRRNVEDSLQQLLRRFIIWDMNKDCEVIEFEEEVASDIYSKEPTALYPW